MTQAWIIAIVLFTLFSVYTLIITKVYTLLGKLVKVGGFFLAIYLVIDATNTNHWITTGAALLALLFCLFAFMMWDHTMVYVRVYDKIKRIEDLSVQQMKLDTYFELKKKGDVKGIIQLETTL